jgi:hypothetical protein
MRILVPQIWPRLVLVASLFFALATRAVDLQWGPSPDAATPGKITGYKIYYAPGDFTQPPTNGLPPIAPLFISVGSQTNGSVTNLVGGLTYFFAVVSIDSDGVESDYSNVASITAPSNNVPPPPDPTNTSTNGGSTTGSTTGSISNSVPTEINLIGMVPRLWLYPTNGQALLAVQGTVGATFQIQYSTNPAAADSWITITNLKLSAAAPNAATNGTTTLEKAFIPALESYQDPNPIDGVFRYYRIYMPLGYPILANQVLASQSIDSRLIAVRLPGINAYIVCYVTPEAAYLDYNDKTYIVKLESSGPTIREVANKVSTTLAQNWTSASEFTVTDDGAKLLFATVVQTDDPSTDPPLGVPRTSSSSIIIDF